MNISRDNLLKYSTFVLVFLTPILYFSHRVYPHITSKTFFFYGITSIIFFYWAYLITVDKSYLPSKKQILLCIPLFLYVGWMTLAGVLAVNPHLSFWSSFGRGMGLLTLYFSTVLTLVISSLIARDGKKYILSLIKWFIAGAFIVALTVWMGPESLNFDFKFLVNGGGGGGITGNSSLAAAYLIFAIFLGLFSIFDKEISRSQKKFTWVTIVTIILSPLFINISGLFNNLGLLGNARGALLGILAGAFFVGIGYILLSNKKSTKLIGYTGVIGSLILFFVIWIQLMTPGTTIHDKFTNVASGTRFLFWEAAQKSIDKHPYFGYGPENFMIAFEDNFNPKILNKSLGYESWTDRAHNIYFDTGVSGGYPAIIFYAIFILSIFYFIYRLNKSGKISRIQASILFGLIVAYVFQNLFYFDSTLSMMALFIVLGIILGSYGMGLGKRDKNVGHLIKSKSSRVLASLVLCTLCVISLTYFSILPARKAKMFGTIFNLPINERSNHYEELLSGASIGNDWDVSGLADDAYKMYAKDPLNTKTNPKLLPYADKDLTSLIKYLETVAEENTTDFRLYIKIVHLYNTLIFVTDKSNDPELVGHISELLEKAHKLAPTNPEVYWGIAQLDAWNNDFKGIEKAYKDAITLDPSTPESYLLLLKFAEATGNQKLYNDTLNQAKTNVSGFTLE